MNRQMGTMRKGKKEEIDEGERKNGREGSWTFLQ